MKTSHDSILHILCHKLNSHFLVLVERRLIVARVLEPRGAREGVGGHHLRVLQRTVALEVIGDAGCAHRMIADARFDGCLARAAESCGNRPAVRPPSSVVSRNQVAISARRE
jgi:hypothetical protein